MEGVDVRPKITAQEELTNRSWRQESVVTRPRKPKKHNILIVHHSLSDTVQLSQGHEKIVLEHGVVSNSGHRCSPHSGTNSPILSSFLLSSLSITAQCLAQQCFPAHPHWAVQWASLAPGTTSTCKLAARILCFLLSSDTYRVWRCWWVTWP